MRIALLLAIAALVILPGCGCCSDYCYDCGGCYGYYCSTLSEDYSDEYYDSLDEELAAPDPAADVW